MDRREYLKKAIRLSLLSVVLGLGGFLGFKSLESDACTENSFCKNCKKYDDCDLDEKEVINE